MGPGLPCDCAVNTAVLSQREPARHRETLSSLLLLIEKPIAIYVLTLDTESIPRGTAPAQALLGCPHTCACPRPAAAGVRCWGCSRGTCPLEPELRWDRHMAPAPRRAGNLCSRGLVSCGISFVHVFCEDQKCGCPKCLGPAGWSSWIPSVLFVCFPVTGTAEPDGLSGIDTHLLRKT